jgi:hypothetical protein
MLVLLLGSAPVLSSSSHAEVFASLCTHHTQPQAGHPGSPVHRLTRFFVWVLVLSCLPLCVHAGVDMLIDVHGDEELPYCFIAGSEGIPGWSERMTLLQVGGQGRVWVLRIAWTVLLC